jgi:hypothetical protein
VLVTNELTCSSTSGSDTETINNVIETALQVLEKNLTGNTVGLSGCIEHVAELTLQHTISVLCLLLLCELSTILRLLAATVVALLPWREITLRENLVRAEDWLAETAGNS